MPVYAPEMPAKLAESAFRLFSKGGIKNVTLDQIAADAGVTKGSLYWHYKSKHDLILAACAHYYSQYRQGINIRLKGVTNPRERLERTVHQGVKTCLLDSQNRVFTLEVFTLSLYDQEIRDSWRKFVESVREFYARLVSDAKKAGALVIDDEQNAVGFMLDAMEGIKQRALYEPGICSPDSEKAICQNLLRILGAAEGND